MSFPFLSTKSNTDLCACSSPLRLLPCLEGRREKAPLLGDGSEGTASFLLLALVEIRPPHFSSSCIKLWSAVSPVHS